MNKYKLKCRQLLLLVALALPLQAAAKTVDEIMDKVDYVMKRSFTTQLTKVKLTTCNYRVKKGRMGCIKKPRVVVIENAKKITDDDVHARSLAIILEPISDKGIGMLTYEYEQRGRENDNWLYLSALGKANRIVSNSDESGSVFGSEFSIENTENPEARKIYEYDYKLLREEEYQGEAVWVVEMIPTKEKAAKTQYEKLEAWISKKSYYALKENYYRNGKVHKQRLQKGIKKVDGVWIATKVTMKNLSTKRISQMDKTSVAFEKDISNEFLTQRALTDFAFRERNLTKFREHLYN